MITVLTGITEAMLLPAPRIAEVLPAFLEFAHDAVIVGHNIRFDCGFLDAALVAHGYPRLSHRRVDTVALARRLVRDEVPNLQARARSPATSAPRSSRCTAPTPTRPRPPRCCTRCSSGRPRSACSASTISSRCRRCARTRRRPSSRSPSKLPRAARRVPVPRPRRARALRRQGDEPAGAGALVLLDRRPAQGAAAAAGDGDASSTACAAGRSRPRSASCA